MSAAQLSDLVDQLCRFLIRNEAGCLYCVDQYLQFGNTETTILNVVSLFFSDPVPHDFIPKFIKNSDVLRQRPALTRNAHLYQPIANCTGG